jgi:hypothetical protein
MVKMEDFFVLKIPAFNPKYKKWDKYGYTHVKERDKLKAVLEESTEGFCMYCFSRIRVDGKLYANLEHAIEKSNSNKLIECVPNIGLSCTVCNQTFKRTGEKKRKLSESVIEQFENSSRCSVHNRKQCTVPCKALRELQKNYSCMPNAEIILQPMGVKGSESNEELSLQYNILNMEFEPAEDKFTYSSKEIKFIRAHIMRFRLNDSRYRSCQLFDFVRNVIDNNGNIPTYEYNNLIVNLFQKRLLGRSREEVLKICKSIFMITFTKMQGVKSDK